MEITAPMTARVITESGSFACEPGHRCTLEVSDTQFNETFVVEPTYGHVFRRWQERPSGLCGGSTEPCRLSTLGFPGHPNLMAMLRSDQVFYLEPVVTRVPDDWTPLATALANVTDSTLRQCLERATLGLVYAEQLERLTCGNRYNPADHYSQRDIGWFDGLEAFTSLRTLQAETGWGLDLEPLRGLTALTTLHLDAGLGNAPESPDILAPLAGMTGMRSLALMNLGIADITILRAMPKLSYLDLSANLFRDLKAIEGRQSLRSLHLVRNNNLDFQAVWTLTELRKLSLSYNYGDDIHFRGVEGLTKLKYLSLRGQQLTDISRLAALTQLETLELEGNNIRDIDVVSGLSQLKHLRLVGNPIDDFSALEDKTLLETLTVSMTSAEQAYLLAPLRELHTLALEVEEGFDPGFIAGMSKLRDLTVANSHLTSLDFVTGLRHLESLVAPYNKITDLAPLTGLSELKHLDLRHNGQYDSERGEWATHLALEPLSGLSQLESLSLDGNGISDITSLNNLGKLRYVGLDYNRIERLFGAFDSMTEGIVDVIYNQIPCSHFDEYLLSEERNPNVYFYGYGSCIED